MIEVKLYLQHENKKLKVRFINGLKKFTRNQTKKKINKNKIRVHFYNFIS